MFRYIYPLNQEAIRLLGSYPEYATIPYPKDEDLFFSVRIGCRHYEKISSPWFNRDICHYNSQKFEKGDYP